MPIPLNHRFFHIYYGAKNIILEIKNLLNCINLNINKITNLY